MHKGKRAAKIKGATGVVGKVAVMGLLERHGPDGHSPRAHHASSRTSSAARWRPKCGSTSSRAPTSSPMRSRPTTVSSRDYIHEVIDHAETYVKGKVHTNGLENFWSLLKRAIKGTYVSRRAVPPVPLPR